MANVAYRRGDIIMHPMAGGAWLHIAEVKYNDYRGYVYECVNQKTGKKVTLLADGNDSITLVSKGKR